MNQLKGKLIDIHQKNKEKIPKYVTSKRNSVASVLVVLQFNSSNNTWNVLLTKRSSDLKSFPGQISFPGGNVESTDIDEEATALRETREEIGIENLEVNIVARLPPQIVASKMGHIFIGIVDEGTDLLSLVRLADSTEVEAVFLAPVALFLSSHSFTEMPFTVNKDGHSLQMHVPSFSLQIPAVTNGGLDPNMRATVFGFTASVCVYTAILIFDRPPSFDGQRVHISSRSSEDVYDDLIARLTFVLRLFNLSNFREVSEPTARI